MSTKSDQSTELFSGLIIGAVILSAFGLATFVVFGLTSLKKPTDRIFEGDFSETLTAQRMQTRRCSGE